MARINSSGGDEPCNGELGQCVALITGLDPNEGRGLYGGNDDTHDCGTIEFARIEFTGFTFGGVHELNNLTVAGCGSKTRLSHIQAHRGRDDGFQFLGGTASASHLIVTGSSDDGLDWDQGYTGTVENIIVHHFAPSGGDPRGFEGANDGNDHDLLPRSAPTITYGTLIGSEQTDRGIVNRRGTLAVQRGLIVTEFAKAGVDIRNASWDLEDGWPTGLVIADSCFYNNSPNTPEDLDCGTDDELDCNDANDSGVYFAENVQIPLMNVNGMDTNPQLGDVTPAVTGDGTPNYAAANEDCAGAFAPEGIDWTLGWTAFPVD